MMKDNSQVNQLCKLVSAEMFLEASVSDDCQSHFNAEVEQES